MPLCPMMLLQCECLKTKTPKTPHRMTLGPVVRRLISANPGLDFDPGFFFCCPKVFSRIIFPIFPKASNHRIVGEKS